MRKMVRGAALAGSVVLLAALTACAPQRHVPTGYPATATPYPASAAVGTEYGRVHQIEVLPGRQRAQTSGAGAVSGAVVGGVLGNQVGRGGGRAAATAVGVIGGAVAGNAIEGSSGGTGADQSYRLTIQFDRGGYRAYDVGSVGDLRTGDRVRVYNGQISRY